MVFSKANAIERVHLQFCKRLLGVKNTTQNEFDELGRTSCITIRYILMIKYWFRILLSEEVKYIKLVYNMMLDDWELNPNMTNWSVIVLCFVVRYFMSILVLQSSWWGRKSWLLCLIILLDVSWWLSGSSSRCHGVVCGLWLWYFLILLTYYLSPLHHLLFSMGFNECWI